MKATNTQQGFTRKLAQAVLRHRRLLLVIMALITLGLGYSASKLRVEAGFMKMIPLSHEYMSTFLDYQGEFVGANRIMVSLRNEQGTVFEKDFLAALKKATEEVFYLEGVERSSVTSLFTPNARYSEVVEEGFTGGNLIEADYSGTEQELREIRSRTLKSNWVGRIVSNDLQSAMVVATLQEVNPDTGERIDLQAVGNRLEEIRAQLETDDITVNIIGFSKAIGDIANGARGVLVFFAVAVLIIAVLLYWYTRSKRLTALTLVTAAVPVVWLLGLLPLLGLTLDPMSILVPFLIFAIAVSHAVQMCNAWKLDVLQGADIRHAAEDSLSDLLVPSVVALAANVLGFLVIAFVDIEMVHELALTATLGVGVMILTNSLVLPPLLSMIKLDEHALDRLTRKGSHYWFWEKLSVLATTPKSYVPIACALVLAGFGIYQAGKMHVGDLGDGVPELRDNARYNQDVRAVTSQYSVGVDVLQVIVEAKGDNMPCVQPHIMQQLEEFELFLRQQPGVASVGALPGFVKGVTQNYAETSPKWHVVPGNKAQVAQGVAFATRNGSTMMNADCDAMAMSVFLSDHKAETISGIVSAIKSFKSVYDNDELTYRLAAGNVGVMAATNEAVTAANPWVNAALFVSVTLLCLAMFRSFRISLCIILPLALVTLLCNAFMSLLGIGLKVNTLPVIALGVGSGIDYGIYLFERMKHELDRDASVQEAFFEALKQRGTASAFTALTMTVSVATWYFSDLKFQADMGILLAFMFLVNLFGAILLLPAIAAVLFRGRKTVSTARSEAEKGRPVSDKDGVCSGEPISN
ncbi:efflux RND transporter permease subunit [Marinobacter sp. chi1]|uniref:Efflux RND transporter permease subunit n=1 Tax=Marinobacter suaedae TaxID=3057675 RepID=A0ABT8W067_9GAMM|nr:efflux RND transporter permease subunit [Marinobacter sp. chi1]MDO3721651.1 efflux RND transporter permease subunit [Marinobacter sp. chi1]